MIHNTKVDVGNNNALATCSCGWWGQGYGASQGEVFATAGIAALLHKAGIPMNKVN